MKEFLRPTKGKLIILAIFEIPLLSYYYSYGNNVSILCSSLPCPLWEEFSARWFGPLIILVIPLSVILYLIFCVVIEVYGKLFHERD